MRNSIVSIESVSNNSFGTGFIIDSDAKGVYVLTCQHVLDDVETPVVENVLAKVVAKGGFIDMAILYVSKLHLNALPLQTKECDQLDVEVIGFSHFNQSLTQKKHIQATLYQELIELHSKEEDAYYNVRKIKANDGFNFDRGNSGSPVICKSSGNVIAMISNKEGNDIGYAIDIANLKEVWKDAPSKLFEKQRAIIEPVSGTKGEAPQQKETVATQTAQKSNSSSVKYLIVIAILLGISFGAYSTLVSNKKSEKDRIAQEEKTKKEAEAKHQQALKEQEEARKKAEAEKERLRQQIKRAEEEAKAREEARKKEQLRREQELKKEKALLDRTLQYEKAGFQALMNKKYTLALNSFKYANKLKAHFHHLPQITALLSKNIGSMNRYNTKRKVFDEMLKRYTQYAPKGFIENIKKQIKLPRIITPEIPHRVPIIIQRPELKVRELKEIKVIKQPTLDLSKVRVQELQRK